MPSERIILPKPTFETALKDLKESLNEVDDITLIVLKGHLQLEAHLDNIISESCFYPEALKKIGLRFHQKILLAKGLSPRKDDNLWSMMQEINTLRNHLAHRKELEKNRDKYILKIHNRLHKFSKDLIEESALVENLENGSFSDEEILKFAIIICLNLCTHNENLIMSGKEIFNDMVKKGIPILDKLEKEGLEATMAYYDNESNKTAERNAE